MKIVQYIWMIIQILTCNNLQLATYIINEIQNRLARNISCKRKVNINAEIVANIQRYLNDKERGCVSNNMEIAKEAIF